MRFGRLAAPPPLPRALLPRLCPRRAPAPPPLPQPPLLLSTAGLCVRLRRSHQRNPAVRVLPRPAALADHDCPPGPSCSTRQGLPPPSSCSLADGPRCPHPSPRRRVPGPLSRFSACGLCCGERGRTSRSPGSAFRSGTSGPRVAVSDGRGSAVPFARELGRSPPASSAWGPCALASLPAFLSGRRSQQQAPEQA